MTCRCLGCDEMSCGLPDCDECIGDTPNPYAEPEYTALIAHINHPECSAPDYVTHPYTDCTARWIDGEWTQESNDVPAGIRNGEDGNSPTPDDTSLYDRGSVVYRPTHSAGYGGRHHWNGTAVALAIIVGSLFVLALAIVGFYYG